jgi:hypothetical protein
MPTFKHVKKFVFDLIHHFIFTSWSFVWGYLLILSAFVWIFLGSPYRYGPTFDFFAYDNNPMTVQNLFLLEIEFVFVSFLLGFLAKDRLPKVNKLLAFFTFLVLLSLTMLFLPIITGILIAPKAN